MNEIATKTTEAHIVPKETYRVKATIITKNPRLTRDMTQLTMNITAAAVSAPLPPLNPK